MKKRDPEKTEKLRKAVRYLVERGEFPFGIQSRLGEHFQVTRQRVHQVVVEEKGKIVAKAS